MGTGMDVGSLDVDTDFRGKVSDDFPAGRFKASAWQDLGERQARGEPIDTKKIRKHANDVLRLSQLLAPDTRAPVAERIAQDLNRCLDAIRADRSIDPKSFKIDSSVGEIGERIARAYGLSRPREA